MTEQEFNAQIEKLFAKIDLMKIALVNQGIYSPQFEAIDQIHTSLYLQWKSHGKRFSDDYRELTATLIQMTDYWKTLAQLRRNYECKN